MSTRSLIEKAPLDALLTDVAEREQAAKALHDDRTAAVLGEIRRDLDAAIADAERPPEDGETVEEEARRAGVSKWAIYKRRQRARSVGRAA